VFLVLVRFAYGFLDFLFTYNLYWLCPFAPPALLLRGSSLLRADAPWISRSFPTCAAEVSLHNCASKDWCAVHGSFVPYALAFHIGFSPFLWPDCHLWLVWTSAGDIWP